MEADLRRRDSFLLNQPLKLHVVRISPACRIVWWYCLRNNLPLQLIDIDVFSGQHDTKEFRQLNPNGETPVLVDGDVVIYEAVPILLYLGEKYTQFACFGADPGVSWKVKSLLSWVSTKLHTTVGYRVVYPNFIESYQPGEEATETFIDKGTIQLTRELEFLENGLLGGSEGKYLCGDDVTLADYFAATVLVQLDWVGFEFGLWRRVCGWLDALRTCEHWKTVHEKHDGFVMKLKSSHDFQASSASK